jgi:Cupin superfamily (DUF985)
MSTAHSYLPNTAAELVELLGLIPHPEGGYFLETFRSGSVPMTSRGQTDLAVSNADCLVTTTGRNEARPDQSPLRNALTSIYWLPTVDSPIQPLMPTCRIMCIIIKVDNHFNITCTIRGLRHCGQSFWDRIFAMVTFYSCPWWRGNGSAVDCSCQPPPPTLPCPTPLPLQFPIIASCRKPSGPALIFTTFISCHKTSSNPAKPAPSWRPCCNPFCIPYKATRMWNLTDITMS